ncbi:MAG: hypothetical protein IPN76_31790 [Saprospiraceae bacterium]|nr:hypothetical protein [Saprospiraceae bacterium]
MFGAFEQKYGDQLLLTVAISRPIGKDGAVLLRPRKPPTNRNTAEQLVQAQAPWAMLDAKGIPAAEFDEAWTNVLLFSEHTWGAVSSKSDPDIDFTTKQWEVKKGFANNAERQTNTLIDKALGKMNAPKRCGLEFPFAIPPLGSAANSENPSRLESERHDGFR